MSDFRIDNPSRVLDATGAVTGRGLIVQTASGELEAPQNIIMTVAAAKTYYINARTEHVERIKLYASIIGLIEGNPPYDPVELHNAGLDHITNVNFLDAKSQSRRTCLTFWNLLNQTASWFKFRIRKFQSQEDQDYTTWAEIMGRNLTEVFEEMWPNFVTEYNTMVTQLVQLGLSPIVFSNERDFRWRTVELSRFYVADKTLTNSDHWDYVCIETPFQMQYLWQCYNKLTKLTEEARANQPWNMAVLERLLITKANNTVKNSSPYYGALNSMDIERAVQSLDTRLGPVFSDQIPLVSMFYKEYSGKVSHYIFDPINGDENNFLFMISEQYNEFKEGIMCFTYEPGHMYLHDVRGQGHMIYPACQALMQADGHMFDMIKIAATPIIESQSSVGRDVNPIRFVPGTVTDIGPAKLSQNVMGGNLGHIAQGAQYLERKLNRNAQISGDDPSLPDMDRGSKSAQEVQNQSIKEFGVGKQVVAHFYKQMDELVKQMVIKIFHSKVGDPCYPIVKEWKDRCIDEGVPAQLLELNGAEEGKLPKYISVRAARVAGDGSSLGLMIGLRTISPIVGRLGEEGQYNYTYDTINSALGSDYAERYMVDMREPDEAGGGASVAMLENIVMKGGETPQAARENQHKAHIGSHMALATNMMQMMQAGEMDPVSADKVFSILVPHIKDHVGFLSEDSLNEEFIKQIEPAFRQVVKFAQINRNKAQMMQRAEVRRRQEEEQAMTAEQMKQERENFKLQSDIARADRKVEAQVERAKEANATRAEIMKRATEDKAENERLAVTLKAENERKKVETSRNTGDRKIFADTTTAALQENLRGSIGVTPSPVDFE